MEQIKLFPKYQGSDVEDKALKNFCESVEEKTGEFVVRWLNSNDYRRGFGSL